MISRSSPLSLSSFSVASLIVSCCEVSPFDARFLAFCCGFFFFSSSASSSLSSSPVLQVLAEKVTRIDPTGLDPDILQKIAQIVPTPEEAKKFDDYDERKRKDPEKTLPLRDVEEKMRPFLHLPRLATRLRILKAAMQWMKTVQDIEGHFALLNKAADEVHPTASTRAFTRLRHSALPVSVLISCAAACLCPALSFRTYANVCPVSASRTRRVPVVACHAQHIEGPSRQHWYVVRGRQYATQRVRCGRMSSSPLRAVRVWHDSSSRRASRVSCSFSLRVCSFLLPYTQARNSKRFRLLLQAVLQWGNFVNHGVTMASSACSTPRPEGDGKKAEDKGGESSTDKSSTTSAAAAPSSSGAVSSSSGIEGLPPIQAVKELPIRGFALNSFLKLMEFKTTVDPNISSLHFIVANVVSLRRLFILSLLFSRGIQGLGYSPWRSGRVQPDCSCVSEERMESTHYTHRQRGSL